MVILGSKLTDGIYWTWAIYVPNKFVRKEQESSPQIGTYWGEQSDLFVSKFSRSKDTSFSPCSQKSIPCYILSQVARCPMQTLLLLLLLFLDHTMLSFNPWLSQVSPFVCLQRYYFNLLTNITHPLGLRLSCHCKAFLYPSSLSKVLFSLCSLSTPYFCSTAPSSTVMTCLYLFLSLA